MTKASVQLEHKDVIVSPVMEEMDEVMKLIPQVSQSVPEGRTQERISEEFVDAFILQVMEEVFEIVKRIPQETCPTGAVSESNHGAKRIHDSHTAIH